MTPNPDPRPLILQKLDGHWTVTGNIKSKPVQYHVVNVPALQGQFTEISMEDVKVPSQYEARIFIGFDGDTNTVIAHWMDNFGVNYSIPYGTGSLSENAITFIVPYPDGSFKDSFVYNPEDDSWTLAITAQQPDSTWKHFAKYDFRPA
ncbi:MAG: DUF1579 family protein [Anaerolineales bacterium]|nr:DUF1579 family protein [Anaerolineales bacterium]